VQAKVREGSPGGGRETTWIGFNVKLRSAFYRLVTVCHRHGFVSRFLTLYDRVSVYM